MYKIYSSNFHIKWTKHSPEYFHRIEGSAIVFQTGRIAYYRESRCIRRDHLRYEEIYEKCKSK